ncbi:HD-GYP domain-containing protein [Rhodoferax sp. 4810]|nr:HD-GYP domain-containing protein [Rhodoferax jenense]
MAQTTTITPAQLQVGMYVHLDLKWFDHPFAFSHFKITSEDQIKTIRSLGLKALRFSPELSDVAMHTALSPFDSPVNAPAVAAPVPAVPQEPSPAMQAKRAMMAQMKQRRETAERIERAFVDTAKTVRDIEKNLYNRPAETVQQASKLVQQIADSILSAPELAIQVMGDKLGGEELYFHSLNVTMLSMMMARDLKLPVEVVGVMGVGALLHDIGRKEVPDKILLKTEPLTPAERNFYELHPNYGVELGKRMHLSAAALAIIGEHHELYDGTGYPNKLKGEAIHLLSRIVVIANYYDELCNPASIADALTPHEALSLMFAKLRSKFDPKLLSAFIRCLGVYPPGTIVQLSNGFIGMVSTVNTARPMKPIVVVYDAEVPKEEAILLDMDTQADLNIGKAIRPAQVPREVYIYLSPRKRVSYYFDAAAARPSAGHP